MKLRIHFFSSLLLSILIICCSEKNEVTPSDFPDLDKEVEGLMKTHFIPGAQLAIVKDEKLVYLRSYGLADVQTEERVDDESLFRIASVSKPITAIGVLKLTEMELLDLDDHVFGANGILETTYGTTPYSADKGLITVRHLLEHTSGWINQPYDPMFFNLNFSHPELIGNMLDERTLVYEPGHTYYYLNFGYCVLGRIIEKVSGKTYSQFIKDEVLSPSNISQMEIGGNTADEIQTNEVKYYGQENFSPYNMNVTRMDSPGGWIASAKDLAKFLVAIDRNQTKADLLSTTVLNNMYFGEESWIFYGSLPGTSAGLSRVNDSFGYAFLVNTRTIPVGDIPNEMRDIILKEINGRTEWPDRDLFVE